MATKTPKKTKTKTKINLKPLHDRLIIAPDEAETTTASGIVLPDAAQEKPQQGTVIAAGPGGLNDDGERTPLTVKVGDKVIYGKFSGTNVTIEGEDYILVREAELLAKIEN